MLTRDFSPYGLGSILHDIDAFQREFNRLFNGAQTGSTREYPAVNAYQNENELIIKAEAPGMEPASLDLTVENNTLTIKGKRPEDASEKGTYYRKERLEGEFSRTLRLPYSVDADKVDAVTKNGVLTITLKRHESEKPKKIQVKNA